ncbi:uncharacterized protein LOC101861686 [Aplysia californica]|uniref:Uncharacterized protein LOC101861686 n=1 Tax=Aplysia californica TaxID=6500 RepID=A0ABM0K2M6_APLCA|nr:uncharacterized protein LOC101861686 [Aplysia californica]XP_005107329.1 uncharacterized protein LOC101861686 [Aplysia californica]
MADPFVLPSSFPCTKSLSANCISNAKCAFGDILDASNRESQVFKTAVAKRRDRIVVSRNGDQCPRFYELAKLFSARASRYDIAGAQLLMTRRKTETLTLSKILKKSIYNSAHDRKMGAKRKYPAFVSSDLYNSRKTKKCKKILFPSSQEEDSGGVQNTIDKAEGKDDIEISRKDCIADVEQNNKVNSESENANASAIRNTSYGCNNANLDVMYNDEVTLTPRGTGEQPRETACDNSNYYPSPSGIVFSPEAYRLQPLQVLMSTLGGGVAGGVWKKRRSPFCDHDCTIAKVSKFEDSKIFRESGFYGDEIPTGDDEVQNDHQAVPQNMETPVGADECHAKVHEHVWRWIENSRRFFQMDNTEIGLRRFQERTEEPDSNRRHTSVVNSLISDYISPSSTTQSGQQLADIPDYLSTASQDSEQSSTVAISTSPRPSPLNLTGSPKAKQDDYTDSETALTTFSSMSMTSEGTSITTSQSPSTVKLKNVTVVAVVKNTPDTSKPGVISRPGNANAGKVPAGVSKRSSRTQHRVFQEKRSITSILHPKCHDVMHNSTYLPVPCISQGKSFISVSSKISNDALIRNARKKPSCISSKKSSKRKFATKHKKSLDGKVKRKLLGDKCSPRTHENDRVNAFRYDPISCSSMWLQYNNNRQDNDTPPPQGISDEEDQTKPTDSSEKEAEEGESGHQQEQNDEQENVEKEGNEEGEKGEEKGKEDEQMKEEYFYFKKREASSTNRDVPATPTPTLASDVPINPTKCPSGSQSSKSHMARIRCGQQIDLTEKSFLLARNCLLRHEHREEVACKCFYKDINPKRKLTIDRILKGEEKKSRPVRETLCSQYNSEALNQHVSAFQKSKLQELTEAKPDQTAEEASSEPPDCEDAKAVEDFFQNLRRKPQIDIGYVMQSPLERLGFKEKKEPVEYIPMPGPIVLKCEASKSQDKASNEKHSKAENSESAAVSKKKNKTEEEILNEDRKEEKVGETERVDK